MAENKSFLDTLAESGKPESFGQEKFIYASGKGKRKKTIIAIIIIIFVLAASYTAYTYINRVKVPDLVGMNLSDASDWALKNKITLSAKSIYDFDIAENIVMSQEIKAGAAIDKNSTISIRVSLGPDPEEVITFPDIGNMTASQIEAWINDNKLTGAKIATANSDVVAVDKVISYAFTDGSKDNFKRKNRVTITVSLGPATVSETVVVADFSSMKAGAVLQWGIDNGVRIILTEAFDNYISDGSVISQSIKTDTEIKRTDSITVVISKGKSVTVPRLSGMTKDEAMTWAKLNNVTLTVLDEYSNSIPAGTLYNQSIAAGDNMEEGNEIKLDCSLGRVDVASYIGRTKLDVLNWQNTANEKGAKIKLVFTEAYGDKGTGGTIIDQSIKNDMVNTGTTISITVSKGLKTAAPDLAGKTVEECSAIAKDTGLAINFNYLYSNTVVKDYVISQSPAGGAIITDSENNEGMTVTISLGKVDISGFIGKTKLDILNWQTGVNGKGAGIKLAFRDAYGDKGTAGTIISQSVKNELVDTGTTINIVISKGMKIVTPDFSGKTEDECNTISKETGVKVLFDYQSSRNIIKGYVISQLPAKDTVITDTDTVTIAISLTGISSDSIVVGDFSTMKASAILQWGTDNGVTVNLSEAYDSYIPSGNVISQSVAKNTVIKKTTNITVVISKGQPSTINYVTVPNFAGMSQDEANTWARQNNITLTISGRYSNYDDKGLLYSQGATAGSLISAGSGIKLVYSLGRVDVASYIGKTKLDIVNWQKNVNANGANITLAFTEDYGEKGSVGKIMSQSVTNDFVNTGTTINAVISLGMKIATPDFTGKTEAECTTIGRDTGLTILFDYQSSDSITTGYVISQSYAKNTIITDADTITIVISLGS